MHEQDPRATGPVDETPVTPAGAVATARDGGLEVRTDDPDVQVVRWDAPTWASHGTEVEGGWLHTHEAGTVPLEGDEGDERPCPVRLECTDLAYGEAGQTVLRRSGPRVVVGDLAQLSLAEAERLAAALTEVVERARTRGAARA